MICAVAARMLCGSTLLAQAPANLRSGSTDVGVSYIAERSLRAGSTQNFWMTGGSAEAATSMWRGIGPAVNVTGATTGSIGSSNVPLSLVTFTAGPRVRFRDDGRWSPYGEALFGVAHGFNSIFPNPGSSLNHANSFAMQAGGGVDVRFPGRLFVRAVDVSYVRTQLPNGTNGVQNTLRIGAGIGLTLGRVR